MVNASCQGVSDCLRQRLQRCLREGVHGADVDLAEDVGVVAGIIPRPRRPALPDLMNHLREFENGFWNH